MTVVVIQYKSIWYIETKKVGEFKKLTFIRSFMRV